jgi:lipopolysaccharide transport system ATP-binding protein
MSDLAVEVKNLGKKYSIGETVRHDTFRDAVCHFLQKPFQKRHAGKKKEDVIWALKDVSFGLGRGETIGIIGRNGAGKSTLLKILSRITEPTEGEVRMNGRVGSLLEVGTGFHPELTGRENIFLNGAILGMGKREIKAKFDEIVAFSEVEKFIDTPVKRYSSGMYVRLAFSVAAHLEPEILLVDEVLAVGDIAFQKKCLGKMSDVAGKGRTVLFVSHNMAAVLSLCRKAIMMEGGRVTCQGTAQEVVRHYFQSVMASEQIPLGSRPDRQGDGSVRMVSLRLENADPDKVIRSLSRLKVTIEYESSAEVVHPRFLVGIYDLMNQGVFLLNSETTEGFPEVLPARGRVVCVTDPIRLTPGRCYVNLALYKANVMADYVQYAGFFDVEIDERCGTGKIPSRDWVLCLLEHEWKSSS